MSDIIKIGTKDEAKRQMVLVDKSLGDIITQIQDLDDEAKELKLKLRETKDAQRLKEISRVKKSLTVQKIEGIGARKMVFRLLRKFGVEMPETKITRLAEKNEQVRALVEAH